MARAEDEKPGVTYIIKITNSIIKAPLDTVNISNWDFCCMDRYFDHWTS